METTRTASVREAKARLSELLRDVQLGREWIITERGTPIARLVSATSPRAPLEERLRRLEALGVIERPNAQPAELPAPIAVADELARRDLDEDRGA